MRVDVKLWRTETVAGVAAFSTVAYILILNPLLLNQLGLDVTTAFWATVLSVGLGTLAMGWFGNLPLVLATVPSLTTTLIATTAGSAGLPWQAALWAVVASGLCCLLLTATGWRYHLLAYFPPALQHSLVFATAGLLGALSLQQAGLANYAQQWLELKPSAVGAGLLVAGLLAIVLAQQWAYTRWVAPLLGLIVAAVGAHMLGLAPLVNHTTAPTLTAIPQALWAWLSWDLLSWSFCLAVFTFTIIDFFGGLGRYTGLMSLLPAQVLSLKNPRLKKALYIDSLGSIGSGLIGGGSLSIFTSSSAMGIMTGGRTGLTAIVAGLLILLCLAFSPLIAAVPREATAGVLLFMGYVLVKLAPQQRLNSFSLAVSIITALTSLFTFSLDLAIGVAFAGHALSAWWQANQRTQAWVLSLISVLIWSAIIANRLS